MENDYLKDLLEITPSRNVSDKIYDKIAKLIINDALEEGYTFPNESVLCEQLGVGRGSLREAYKALELSGYVTRTRRGTVVNDKATILSSTPLKMAVKSSDRQDFFDFRLMIETKSAELAAERATKSEVDGMYDVMQKMNQAIADHNLELMVACDQEFHLSMALASHNTLIINTMYALAQEWERETGINFAETWASSPKSLTSITHQHNEVLEAIMERNPDKAKEAIVEHIHYFRR